jgi:hypothetical protein
VNSGLTDDNPIVRDPPPRNSSLEDSQTGMELLTSDMMIIELGVFKRRIPWWGIPYNWVVETDGKYETLY